MDNNKKERQNEFWNMLNEEDRVHYRGQYAEHETMPESGVPDLLRDLFGEHNLKPEPNPETWEEFIQVFHKHTNWYPTNTYIDLPLYGMDESIKKKMIATAKIAKLIDVTYGGRVTDDEWRNHSVLKYYIEPHSETKRFITHCVYRDKKHFVAFHTQKQMEAFLSHESNKQLLKDFFEY